MSSLIVKPRSRLFHGHDWVYSSEVEKAIGSPEDGGTVMLKDRRGRTLGSAIYNSQSQIIARRYCRKKQDLDDDFFHRRISQAMEYRRRRLDGIDVCRIVWSESDGLPGLIVDKYGDCLVVQTLTLAMDKSLPLIVNALGSIFSPRCIVERNDAPIRQAEGMDLRSGILFGDAPGEMEIPLWDAVFRIDPLGGQKTGFYLDQMTSYPKVAGYAPGRNVLDCFANQGAFGVFTAKNGAESVTSVEISADLVARIRQNATRNEVAIEAVEANAFDFLNDAQSKEATYGLIILDPPSFTRSKGNRRDAMRGYKEIHLRALKLLEKGGILATFCCSHHVSESDFREMIVDASVDAKRSLRLLETCSQSADHPILPHIPETEYLKGYILEALPPR